MKKLFTFITPVLLLVGFSSIFIVDETNQVVILQLGKPVKTVTKPGINVKLPFPFQEKITFDDRLLEYDSPPEEILSKDKKTLIVDNYVRWKIVDPLQFLKTVQAIPTAKSRMDDIVYSELRRELGTHDMVEIITQNREEIMDVVTKASNEATLSYGISVVDVRIRRVDLPSQNEESIYARMEAERKRQANKFRSEGEEEAQKIRAATDRDKTIILADAYKEAERIRGEGDAKAVQVYARSYSADPKFYEFVRTLDAYKKVVDDKTTLVLPSGSKLFKLLMDGK
ncbi:MAG: protease modulator HflC [Candidatus Neomarinimicrobiota bacterium]|mgnify:FL=1|jgi:membrane protease subunit HflC|nr:protease modulator HflC [Candidatus Neomarinimicrobiota bacterium]MEC9474604.1 protease modulator HflC [Candidatus Neomarinimicrobiota bacterium]MED5247855.1 protease modulator HflC [Candidatus Neomarinimicrobiota bacterium]MEE3303016.1 protease modulator HflC [Candidatus Neomarinimicrobiota bacterium]|tara:strand:- start:2795 stop:3646 length:852 start_codon:yes stop_codon:yes gene_type:complete